MTSYAISIGKRLEAEQCTLYSLQLKHSWSPIQRFWVCFKCAQNLCAQASNYKTGTKLKIRRSFRNQRFLIQQKTSSKAFIWDSNLSWLMAEGKIRLLHQNKDPCLFFFRVFAPIFIISISGLCKKFGQKSSHSLNATATDTQLLSCSLPQLTNHLTDWGFRPIHISPKTA